MKSKQVETAEITQALADFFDTLSQEQINLIHNNIKIRTYKKNEPFYGEGEIPDSLYCLIRGKVKIYRGGMGGRSQIMRVCNAPELFGYRAALAEEPFLTGAAAIESCHVAVIPMSIILDIIRENALAACFFIKKLAILLGKSDERTVNLTQKHLRGRLAESLIFLRNNYGLEEDGCTLSIYLSREDLASLSNMTTSNAIRTLSAFAQEKIVAIDGKKIKLINLEELDRINRLG